MPCPYLGKNAVGEKRKEENGKWQKVDLKVNSPLLPTSTTIFRFKKKEKKYFLVGQTFLINVSKNADIFVYSRSMFTSAEGIKNQIFGGRFSSKKLVFPWKAEQSFLKNNGIAISAFCIGILDAFFWGVGGRGEGK